MDKALTVFVSFFPSVTVTNQEATVTCVRLVWSCQQVRVRISEIHGAAQTYLQHSSGRDPCPAPELKRGCWAKGRKLSTRLPTALSHAAFSQQAHPRHTMSELACARAAKPLRRREGVAEPVGALRALRAVSKATAVCNVQWNENFCLFLIIPDIFHQVLLQSEANYSNPELGSTCPIEGWKICFKVSIDLLSALSDLKYGFSLLRQNF